MKKVDKALLTEISRQAKISERKRKNYNLHEGEHDPIQRLINALEPGTYVRPHKHEAPDKREVFVWLSGRMGVVEFNDTGEIIDSFILDSLRSQFVAEISSRTYHTIVSLQENAAYYEVKDGPYDIRNDKNFASWAPEEGSPESAVYLQKLIKELNWD